MAKSIKLTNDTYWDSSGITYNKASLDKKINDMDAKILSNTNAAVRQKVVSGDTVTTTTIATVTFTGAYQVAYLICILISCASSSAEDTGLVIFKARSNNTSTSISYGIEKTNTANAEIKQNGNVLSFNIKQTVRWRYLNMVILAKSDNVILK